MAKAAGSSSASVFDVKTIRELVALMEEHQLSEVDLKQAEQQIRLVKGGAQPVAVAAPAVAAPVAAAPQAAAAPSPTAEPAGDGPHIKTITAPMVGTFYSKPKPDSEDFVKVGATVSEDTVVCIIEAMKVFNEIPAEISGKVVEVLVKNEEPVDFGKPLFKLDTRG